MYTTPKIPHTILKKEKRTKTPWTTFTQETIN